MLSPKIFGEDICNLIIGRNVSNSEVTLEDLFMNKVEINFYMFHSKVHGRIFSKKCSSQIIMP